MFEVLLGVAMVAFITGGRSFEGLLKISALILLCVVGWAASNRMLAAMIGLTALFFIMQS